MVYNSKAYDKIFPRKKEVKKVESMVDIDDANADDDADLDDANADDDADVDADVDADADA